MFAEGLSNLLRRAGHVCGPCIGSFCLLAAMAGKHCSSHLELGQSCQRCRVFQLSHTPFLTQNCWEVRPHKLSMAVGWGSLHCAMWTCPRIVVTALLLFHCCHLQILLRFGIFLWWKVHSKKKRAFCNCSGKKKIRCAKTPNCANQKTQHCRGKKIKGHFPKHNERN